MALTHQSTFRVRFYECDAYGHLNNAVYLRYMQESAFNASAAAGYGRERYHSLGRIWLARLTDIEYLRPVVYNELISVTTWVVDIRRVRSIRAYEFHNQLSGELVARAWTDWVYIDIHDGQPRSVPQDIAKVYGSAHADPQVLARRRFVEPPEPPPGVFIDRRRVEWQDIDPAGHVNNAVYLDYLVETAWRYGDAIGRPWEHIQSAGFGIVARRTQIEYRQAARYGDELQIATWLSAPRRSTINRHFAIQRVEDGASIARANSLFACIDLASGKIRRIPDDFLADISANIAPDAIKTDLVQPAD